ncbi:flagella [Thermococcus celericrescens]|uniref:Flagella n=1 Tax=Thermococcus celericrescens TaxID=227598 RepID=A0A117ITP2_9EURY|nr:flagella [Thermococcus celericrescens]KUH33714.1 flagella [Thermococcus celericrescens]
MGFSVSASAAIIFISFLIAASTLYTAWDNSYANVRAAQDEWYNLRLSQLNTRFVLNGSTGTYLVDNTNNYYNVTFHLEDRGITLYAPHWTGIYDGKYVTLYNVSDDNVGFLGDYTYVLPGDVIYVNVTYIPLDSTPHALKTVFENGCYFVIGWYYNGSAVVVDYTSTGCPLEVS